MDQANKIHLAFFSLTQQKNVDITEQGQTIQMDYRRERRPKIKTKRKKNKEPHRFQDKNELPQESLKAICQF